MRAILTVLLLAGLAGCADQDPFKRPQTWSLPPAGLAANDTNLRTMLVNPNDQVAGTGEDNSIGPLSVRPVDLLVTGHRRPLPSVNATDIGAGNQQQGTQGGQGQGGASGTGGAQ